MIESDIAYRSAASAETTAFTLTWWTLAMIAFPEVQRRAQAKIDAVVGRNRLPTFSDAPRLPYVRAIIREIHRWLPVTLFSIPHVSTGEDWYEGIYSTFRKEPYAYPTSGTVTTTAQCLVKTQMNSGQNDT